MLDQLRHQQLRTTISHSSSITWYVKAHVSGLVSIVGELGLQVGKGGRVLDLDTLFLEEGDGLLEGPVFVDGCRSVFALLTIRGVQKGAEWKLMGAEVKVIRTLILSEQLCVGSRGKGEDGDEEGFGDSHSGIDSLFLDVVVESEGVDDI
jgi:hypothetical protein